MLVELTIRDLALIEAAELVFGQGLNAITGETGAGKSLVVGALELVLGGRARTGAGSLVRAGAKQARLEARFELQLGSPRAASVSAFLEAELEDFASDFAETGELILGRSLTASGRTRAHVNQRPVPLKALRGLAGLLLEIHGQNDHQRLCLADEQRALLDAFGGHAARLESYRRARRAALAATRELARFQDAEATRLDRIDLLRFQVGELEEAGLEPGEEARLVSERQLLRHGEELERELGGITEQLSEGEGALVDSLRTMELCVEAWRERVAGLDEPAEALREAVVFAEEAAAGLVSFTAGIDVDPRQLEAHEERLAELERLFAKYRTDESGLLEHLEGLRAELEQLLGEQASSAALDAAAEEALATLVAEAKRLTKARKRAIGPLAKQVEAAPAGLGLDAACFGVELIGADSGAGQESHTELPTWLGPDGGEAVEFRLAANPGEPAAPLAQVASGGEVARIMLALRGVLSAADAARTLVFDEVDSGVGGRLGPAVATRLRELGEQHQVLCVTHLPSIAAAAHHHVKVQKELRAGRTLTVFEELAGEARLTELADMIAGGGAEATARAEAARLVEAFV